MMSFMPQKAKMGVCQNPEIADVRHFEEALDVEGLVDRAMEASRYEVIRFA